MNPQLTIKLTPVHWRKVLLNFTLQLTGLACTCKVWKQRMPNFICLRKTSKYLPANEIFSPIEKNRKFVLRMECLLNATSTRNSVPTKKPFWSFKVKFNANVLPERNKDQDFSKRGQKGLSFVRIVFQLEINLNNIWCKLLSKLLFFCHPSFSCNNHSSANNRLIEIKTDKN